MRLDATITSKGQVTLPQELRRLLGLGQGDKISFFVEDGAITVKPAPKEDDPFEEFEGAFPAFKSKDEVNAWISELRDDD